MPSAFLRQKCARTEHYGRLKQEWSSSDDCLKIACWYPSISLWPSGNITVVSQDTTYRAGADIPLPLVGTHTYTQISSEKKSQIFTRFGLLKQRAWLSLYCCYFVSNDNVIVYSLFYSLYNCRVNVNKVTKMNMIVYIITLDIKIYRQAITSPAISNPEQSVIRIIFATGRQHLVALFYINKSERAYGNTGNLFLSDF